MRKITREAVDAFYGGYNMRSGNTEVRQSDDKRYMYLYLHNNCIAELNKNTLSISNAGWFSKTTKERLNGLRGVSIVQKKGEWYLNGEKWDGEWVEIK